MNDDGGLLMDDDGVDNGEWELPSGAGAGQARGRLQAGLRCAQVTRLEVAGQGSLGSKSLAMVPSHFSRGNDTLLFVLALLPP